MDLNTSNATVATSTFSSRKTRLSSSPVLVLSSSVLVRKYNSRNDRFPVALLWLPYAALTLLLSALLVASFVHFHCKNGHKYKKRNSRNGSWNGNSHENRRTSPVRHVAFSENQTSVASGVAVINFSTSTVSCFRCTNAPSGRHRQLPGCINDSNNQQAPKFNGDITQRSTNSQQMVRNLLSAQISVGICVFVLNNIIVTQYTVTAYMFGVAYDCRGVQQCARLTVATSCRWNSSLTTTVAWWTCCVSVQMAQHGQRDVTLPTVPAVRAGDSSTVQRRRGCQWRDWLSSGQRSAA